MDTIYRRRQPVSRVERLLARLLLRQSGPGPAEPLVDLVHDEDVEFS